MATCKPKKADNSSYFRSSCTLPHFCYQSLVQDFLLQPLTGDSDVARAAPELLSYLRSLRSLETEEVWRAEDGERAAAALWALGCCGGQGAIPSSAVTLLVRLARRAPAGKPCLAALWGIARLLDSEPSLARLSRPDADGQRDDVEALQALTALLEAGADAVKRHEEHWISSAELAASVWALSRLPVAFYGPEAKSAATETLSVALASLQESSGLRLLPPSELLGVIMAVTACQGDSTSWLAALQKEASETVDLLAEVALQCLQDFGHKELAILLPYLAFSMVASSSATILAVWTQGIANGLQNARY